MNFSTLALVLVTVFWGMTFPLIRISIQTISPAQFVFYRFALALLVFAPFAIRRARFARKRTLKHIGQIGFVLGLLNWISYQAQTIGLKYIESGRAAFITGTSVILVPFLSPFFRAGRPKAIDYLSAFGALFGLYLYTDPSVRSVSQGDLWVFLCAFTYAVYIHLLQKWVNDGADTTLLAFFQILGLFTGSGIYCFYRSEPFLTVGGQALVSIVFCAIFASIGTTWIQARYQKETTPERVALIFSLEPVFASAFGFVLLGEELSMRAMMGCSVILLSIVGSEYIKSKKSKVVLSLSDE